MRLPGALRTVGVLCAATLLSAPLFAQGSVVLTVTGGPVTVPAPAVADYNAGFVVDPTVLSYNVNISGGPPTALHTETVSIRSTSGSFGTLAVGNLEWERAGQSTWNSLTTTDVTIESRSGITRLIGNNWTNTVQFRCLIGWTTTPPATYSTNLIITLTVTSP
jgi:hypothetical protein